MENTQSTVISVDNLELKWSEETEKKGAKVEGKFLYAKMLGDFSITYGEKSIGGENSRNQNIWRFIAYLVQNVERPVKQEFFIDRFWGDKSGKVKNEKNSYQSLKTLACRARSMFATLDIEKPDDILQYINKIYRFLPPLEMNFKSDVMEFDAILTRIKKVGLSEKEQTILLNRAINLYGGDYLSKNISDEWVVKIREVYREKFIRIARHLSAIYTKYKKFDELIELCERVSVVYGKEYGFQKNKIIAFMKNGAFELAVEELEKAKKDFFPKIDSNNVTAYPKDFAEIIQQISKPVMAYEPEMPALKKQFSEDQENGVFECENMDIFKSIYRLFMRGEKRGAYRMNLGLFTIKDLHGNIPTENQLKIPMEILRETIISHYRANDAVVKYSDSQYLVLVPAKVTIPPASIFGRVIKSYKKNSGLEDVMLSLKY